MLFHIESGGRFGCIILLLFEYLYGTVRISTKNGVENRIKYTRVCPKRSMPNIDKMPIDTTLFILFLY